MLDLQIDDYFRQKNPLQGATIMISSYGDPYSIVEGAEIYTIKPGDFTQVKLSSKKVKILAVKEFFRFSSIKV